MSLFATSWLRGNSCVSAQATGSICPGLIQLTLHNECCMLTNHFLIPFYLRKHIKMVSHSNVFNIHVFNMHCLVQLTDKCSFARELQMYSG